MSRGEKLLDHFHAGSDEHWVVLKWKKRAEEPMRVAVLRSEQGFAEKAEDALDASSGQHVVYEGADDYCQDQDVIGDVDYYYTAFARRPEGVWEREHTFHVKPKLAPDHTRREVFGPDDPAFLQALDRLRAGLWLERLGRP
jgi:hypothetical protein